MTDKRIPRKRSRRPLAHRLWEKVTVTEGCWLFTGFLDKHGYGEINGGRRGLKFSAHQAAYLVAVGPIPDSLCVLHSCDTPACVRPDHLFLGTQAENMADMNQKGRHCKGEDVHNSKLTPASVVEIRDLIADGHSITFIGRKYGVARATIRDIKQGKTWRHVLAA
jgi:hypothetical protein